MKSLPIILMSHGYFAKEALRSTEMIMGKQERVYVVSVTIEKSLSDVIEETNQIINEIKEEECLFLVDILGGTPSNVAGRFMLEKSTIMAIAGFNLPMLLEIFSNRCNFEGIRESVKNIEKNSFQILNDLIKGD